MITSIKLENFRGFDSHYVPFGSTTVLVGQNNAGKTTIVEALRLVSIVNQRFKNLIFRDPPNEGDLPLRLVGVAPSLKDLEISFKTIFHSYNHPPSTITAKFNNGSSITIYILSDRLVHAVIRDSNDNIVRNKASANSIEIPTVRIMPQVAPLQRNETILSADYITAAMSSRLAPLHFRNQLRVRKDIFDDFKIIVEETWPGVRIIELIGGKFKSGEELHLHIRNEDFVAEVAEMGHGLQMWLQTMWFLTLASQASTVILDEPDVYMHADLQHRLIRFLRNRHDQIIVTTHSPEIMAEVQPDEILVVNKKLSESYFAGSVPAVQAAIKNFGSVHNIHLTRLLGANRMIFVEGKDLKILKEFQDTLFPESVYPFQGLPSMSIGGWSGWKTAVGASMGFHNALGEAIMTYCILDSDYYSQDEIDSRYREAQQKGIQLHIWEQKEIENYLLHPVAISRVIEQRVARRTTPPKYNEVQAKLDCLADEMRDDILDAIATEFWSNNRRLGQTGANKAARNRINDTIDNHKSIISLASGKYLIGQISDWSKSEFGVSFSTLCIAREMAVHEIPSEVISLIGAMDKGVQFPEK